MNPYVYIILYIPSSNVSTFLKPTVSALITKSTFFAAAFLGAAFFSVAAAFAEGDTILGNVEQARIKETDRIKVMRENLNELGVEADERRDALIIHGNGSVKGGKAKGYGDHRVIMALAILGTRTEEETEIDDVSAASVTFPTFFDLLEKLEK